MRKSLARYLHPQDRELHGDRLRALVRLRQGRFREEVRWLRKDGSFCRVQLQVAAVIHPSEGFQGLCGALVDVSAHRAALDALESTRARLQFLLDSSPAVIFTADPHRNYCLTWVSENVVSLLGIPAARFIENPSLWREMIPPEDRDRVDSFYQGLHISGSGVLRHRVVLPNGSVHWVRADMGVVSRSDQVPAQAVGSLIDITEAVLALEKLTSRDTMQQAVNFAAERFLRGEHWEAVLPAAMKRLGEAAGVSWILVIEKTLDAAGKLRFEVRHESALGDRLADNATRPQHGPVPALAFPSAWVDGLLHGEPTVARLAELPPDQRRILDAYDAGSIAIIPVFVGSANWGAICFLRVGDQDWAAETIGVLRITAGIIGAGIQQSQARQLLRQAHVRLEDRVHQRTLQLAEANRALRENEQLFHVLFDEAPIGIAVIGEEARFRITNRSFRRLVGYTAEELATMSERGITHASDPPIALGLDRALEPSEKRYITKSGDEVWTRCTVASLSPVGKESLVVAMIEDVTGRKQLEDQFRQAQKMEAIGRLAGAIAHDFNNLLTVIKGFGELLMKHVADNPSAREKTAGIIRASDRAATLVEQLLAFSRKRIVQPRVVDLNAALVDMESMLRRLIGERIEFSTQLDPAAGFIRIDPGQLDQLVMNLAVNARDAMQETGSLSVSTASLRLGKHMRGPCAGMLPGRYAVLEVRDNGIGMDEETMSRIFEPFYTTKEVGKGTGLGLSTVYGIVGQARGYIAVETALGQGAAFRIYFPCFAEADENDTAVCPERVLTPALKQGRETILVTEDEDSVRELVVEALATCGYTVLASPDGRKALEVVAHYPGNIDLLLTDVVMPQMSGPELWESLAPSHPDMKVLYVSGHSDQESHPGVPLLQKPFSVELLTAKVREVLEGGVTSPTGFRRPSDPHHNSAVPPVADLPQTPQM